jgi:transposase, IS30 family
MHYHHLSVSEREQIQYGLWDRKSIRSIAKELKRSPASVSREIKRNLPLERRVYTPRLAHDRALTKRSSRGRHNCLKNERIREYVLTHLKESWSPEQIAGRIKIDLNENISHEAIYQYVYAQFRRRGGDDLHPGAEDLRIYLRRKRKARTQRGFRQCQRISARYGIPSINERPAIVATRARLGDWESDTVESKDHKPGINTLVERKTGLLLMTKLRAKTSIATATVVSHRLEFLPHHTITFDNGPENKSWKHIEEQIQVQCFFANPYHSWERGTNENTNGLIREDFPKKTDFDTISEDEISRVEYKLNTRPRKRLNYLTPLEAFSVALAG